MPTNRIRAARLAYGNLSKTSLARLIGEAAYDLDAIERGEIDITLSQLYTIAEALGVPPAELLDGPGNEAICRRPIVEAAAMIRIMKTVRAIENRATTAPLKAHVANLIQQLTDLMPELAKVLHEQEGSGTIAREPRRVYKVIGREMREIILDANREAG